MIDELQNNPSGFDFFAAVRLLERHARSTEVASVPSGDGASGLRRKAPAATRREPVGSDALPSREVVRFTTHAALTFPLGDLQRVHWNDKPEAASSGPPRVSVNFLGLIGANGALPQHYTTLILSRLRERDSALRDFLDLFHHRVISLYYRAWKKYRLPVQYEKTGDGDGVDLATQSLYSLIGLGTGGLRGRRAFDDRLCLHFAGTFARQPRPALELERILTAQMTVPVKVVQFFGRWLSLGTNQISRLSGGANGVEAYNRLGENVVIGQRVRDVQSSFRLALGPVTYEQFRRFNPLGSDLRPLCELTRSFVGPEFEFDVQVVLAANQIPQCRLDSRASEGARLGWNTWLRSKEIDHETADAIFLLSDV